jgi:pimeloyl-ACP methyl ester carboxylesterase
MPRDQLFNLAMDRVKLLPRGSPMPYRTVNDTLLSYQEQGAGNPLVLIHGFPLDGRIFDEQIGALSKKFRVIVPDLPGFGQSNSDKPFTIASLADDVHALLAAMDALPCALGGLSMGGYVSLSFAKKYPQDLSRLILIDTRAEGDSPEGKESRNKMIDLVQAKGATAVADQMLPKMFSEQTLKANGEPVKKLRDIMEHCLPKTIEHALMAMRDREDYVSMLASIRVPTLIVVGEQDSITPPKMAQAMHEKIVGSKLVQIPGAGHVSTMERPQEVSETIEEFLNAR